MIQRTNRNTTYDDRDLSPEQAEAIDALRDAAAAAGDRLQVRLCDRAMRGAEDAVETCLRVIAAAKAMDDDA